MGDKMISIKNLNKSYITGTKKNIILNNISFSIEQNEFVGIMGPSGSGKTTLLNTIAHFIPYDSGEIILNGRVISAVSEEEMAIIRNEQLGVVFQDFMLLEGLSVFENICIPQIIHGDPVKQMEMKALQLLKLFNIEQIKDKYPTEISGGQKQRVAVARAMMNNPALVLADEPTGNLDNSSSQAVINSFISARDHLGATILMVTHDVYAASFCSRVLLLQDGVLYKDLKKQGNRDKFMERLFYESKNGGIVGEL